MAYQQTTGNSPDDVIDKIATFAENAGWTVDKNTLVGSNRTVALHKGGDYVWLWNENQSAIRITGSIGFDGGAAISAQTGYAGNYAEANVGVGPYVNVFMFADDTPAEHVHVVIEMSGGVFRHLSFGLLDKLGTWTGGTYFEATNWDTTQFRTNSWTIWSHALFDSQGQQNARCGMVRCDIPADSRENAWASLKSNSSYRALTGLYEGGSYLSSQFYSRNNPPFSGQVTLGTIRLDVQRPGGFWSPVGTVPNLRYLNMARYAPGQEITVGSDTWKVFPMCRKGSGADTQQYSQNHAYAFKKVA